MPHDPHASEPPIPRCFVVIRVDWDRGPLSKESAAWCAKAISVFASPEEADAEADRLNRLNSDKGRVYAVTIAKRRL